jgi:hypothetical protein
MPVERERRVLRTPSSAEPTYAGSAPTDEQLAKTGRATEAFNDARAELDAVKALRPDWTPRRERIACHIGVAIATPM